MIAFLAFIITFFLCAIRSGRKKRKIRDAQDAAAQYIQETARQKELAQREKIRIQIEHENARQKAIETREREKREKSERAQKKRAAIAAAAEKENSRVDILAGYYEKELIAITQNILEIENALPTTYIGKDALQSKLESLYKRRVSLYSKYNAAKTKTEKNNLKIAGY